EDASSSLPRLLARGEAERDQDGVVVAPRERQRGELLGRRLRRIARGIEADELDRVEDLLAVEAPRDEHPVVRRAEHAVRTGEERRLVPEAWVRERWELLEASPPG